MIIKENKNMYRSFRVTQTEWDQVIACFKARTGLRRVSTSQILRELMDDYVATCEAEKAQAQADAAKGEASNE